MISQFFFYFLHYHWFKTTNITFKQWNQVQFIFELFPVINIIVEFGL
jgi:hypothetical protein